MSLPVEIVFGVYLGVITGIVPALVAGTLGFVFKYVTDVTIPGLGVVVLSLAIAGVNGGLLALNDETIRSSERAPAILTAIVVVLMLSMYAHAQGDRLGASVPKRISLKQLRDRTLSTDVIELVGGRGRVSVEVAGEVNDMEGYPPLPADTRRAILDGDWTFPADLPLAELEDRFAERLQTELDLADVAVRIDERARATVAAAPPTGALSKRVPAGKRAVSVSALVPTGIARGDVVRVITPDLDAEGAVIAARSSGKPEPGAGAASKPAPAAGDDPDPDDDARTDGGADAVSSPPAATAPTTTGGEGRVTLALDRSEAAALLRADRGRVLVLSRGTRREYELTALLRRAGKRFRKVSVVAGGPLGRPTQGAGALPPGQHRARRAAPPPRVVDDRARRLAVAVGGRRPVRRREPRRARPVRGGGRVTPSLAAFAGPAAVAAVVDAALFAGGLAVSAVDVGFARPRQAAVTLVTFAVVAALAAGSAALAYRWYFRTEIPEGVTGLMGVSIVALYLNTTSLGSVAVGDNPALLAPESVFFNLVSLGVAVVISPVGRYAGDRLAVDVFALSGAKQLEGELSGVVRAVGRFTAVTLPPAGEIGDMDTYDPVSAEKKAELAETTLLFPRKLSAADLRERLVTRIKDEYGVGYVDADLGEDGTVEYFAVGSRAAGLGPTLAPGSAAVAVSADPPNNATVGDTVQLWRDDPEPKRVATGELRGVAGDAVTVALDESDAERLTEEGGYRLVTLPAEPQADREFASLLRNADETMASVAVGAGSELDGSTVGEVGAVVAAVRPAEGPVQPIPPRAYAFGAGDLVYLVGRPDAIRRFETAAASPADADGADGGFETASAAARDAELDDIDEGTDFDAEVGRGEETDPDHADRGDDAGGIDDGADRSDDGTGESATDAADADGTDAATDSDGTQRS